MPPTVYNIKKTTKVKLETIQKALFPCKCNGEALSTNLLAPFEIPILRLYRVLAPQPPLA